MPVIQFTLLCTCVHRDELIIEMTRPIKWHGLQQTADRVLGPVVELGVPERRWSEHQVGDSWQRIAEAAHPTPGYRNTVLLNGQTPTGEHLMSDEDVKQQLVAERAQVRTEVAKWPRRPWKNPPRW